MSKKKADIFDFDGTLAKDHSANAPEIKKNVKKLKKKEKKGDDVVILTARSAKDRGEVSNWLKEHNIHDTKLVMRPEGDTESDVNIKKKLLNKNVSPQFKVKHAYDDKKKNVNMFKKQGIKAKKV